jgi:hypothetical protein
MAPAVQALYWLSLMVTEGTAGDPEHQGREREGASVKHDA